MSRSKGLERASIAPCRSWARPDASVRTQRSAYFVPHGATTPLGYVARVELENFSPSGVTYINLADTHPQLRRFWGGFFDGAYGYFVKTGQRGAVARCCALWLCSMRATSMACVRSAPSS